MHYPKYHYSDILEIYLLKKTTMTLSKSLSEISVGGELYFKRLRFEKY
jgi:hypothetical protein